MPHALAHAETVSAERSRLVVEAEVQRERARSVLQSLIEAKAECDRHMAKFRRHDAMKAVTGTSALDRAISSTRRMIDILDRAAEDVHHDLAAEGLDGGRDGRVLGVR